MQTLLEQERLIDLEIAEELEKYRTERELNIDNNENEEPHHESMTGINNDEFEEPLATGSAQIMQQIIGGGAVLGNNISRDTSMISASGASSNQNQNASVSQLSA